MPVTPKKPNDRTLLDMFYAGDGVLVIIAEDGTFLEQNYKKGAITVMNLFGRDIYVTLRDYKGESNEIRVPDKSELIRDTTSLPVKVHLMLVRY